MPNQAFDGHDPREDRPGTKEPEMARGKRFSPEQIIAKLRQIEVQLAQDKSLALACKEAGISEQSYYRWRREYGGLQLEQAKRLKELERENARLRRLVADLSLEKQVLKDVAAGNL
jgi:putative transposase